MMIKDLLNNEDFINFLYFHHYVFISDEEIKDFILCLSVVNRKRLIDLINLFKKKCLRKSLVKLYELA